MLSGSASCLEPAWDEQEQAPVVEVDHAEPAVEVIDLDPAAERDAQAWDEQGSEWEDLEVVHAEPVVEVNHAEPAWDEQEQKVDHAEPALDEQEQEVDPAEHPADVLPYGRDNTSVRDAEAWDEQWSASASWVEEAWDEQANSCDEQKMGWPHPG